MQEKKQHKSWASGPGVHPGSSRVQAWGEGLPCVLSTTKPPRTAGPLLLTRQGSPLRMSSKFLLVSQVFPGTDVGEHQCLS